jgi:hypothetical protein
MTVALVTKGRVVDARGPGEPSLGGDQRNTAGRPSLSRPPSLLLSRYRDGPSLKCIMRQGS